MLGFDVNRLKEALAEVEAYTPPVEDVKGVKYLYEKLYKPLADFKALQVSDIDYGAFTTTDFEIFENYIYKTVQQHGYFNYQTRYGLRKLPPASSKIKFI